MSTHPHQDKDLEMELVCGFNATDRNLAKSGKSCFTILVDHANELTEHFAWFTIRTDLSEKPRLPLLLVFTLTEPCDFRSGQMDWQTDGQTDGQR